MPMIAKVLTDIRPDDLHTLLQASWTEDEQMDFKVTIPHREGEGNDPWRNAAEAGGRQIKDYGRNQLLATLVAFANSYGGDLVVGVREAQNSQPGVAEALDPLPDCEGAAHRLAQQAMTCIEPPLPSLQVRAIALEPDGSGVLILRTGQSRMAPHRLSTTKECYHRVRHETLPMTMRQIQDLTFNVARGLESVDRKLAEAARSFAAWTQVNGRPPNTNRLGLRVTGVPLNDLFLETVHNVPGVQPGQRDSRLRLEPLMGDIRLTLPFAVHNWRPALRGSEASGQNDASHARLGVYCDGTIKYEWVRDVGAPARAERPYLLYPGWYFAIIVNAVEAAQKFRVAAGAGAVDYVLECELTASSTLPVNRFGTRIDAAGEFASGTHSFPRYVIGPPAQVRDTYLLIFRDFWNSIGVPTGEEDFLLDMAEPAAR